MDPADAAEEDEEAKRCRLDRSLFALVYHELVASRLEATAKRLLKEAGVESVELKNGIPPRLRDLVDVWNEVQSVPPTRVFPSQRSAVSALSQRAATSSNLSAAIAAAGATATTASLADGIVAGGERAA